MKRTAENEQSLMNVWAQLPDGKRPTYERFREMAGQGKNKTPRTKIIGSQFLRREEKKKPKTTIRNPFRIWEKKIPVRRGV